MGAAVPASGRCSRSKPPPPFPLCTAGASGLQEPLLFEGSHGGDAAARLGGAAAPSGLRSRLSELWQGGEDGEVTFIPASTMVGSSPAVGPEEGRLGMAWLVDPQVGASDAPFRKREAEEEADGGADPTSAQQAARPASRYSSELLPPTQLLAQPWHAWGCCCTAIGAAQPLLHRTPLFPRFSQAWRPFTSCAASRWPPGHCCSCPPSWW